MKQNFRSKNGQVDNEKRSSSANKGSLSEIYLDCSKTVSSFNPTHKSWGDLALFASFGNKLFFRCLVAWA